MVKLDKRVLKVATSRTCSTIFWQTLLFILLVFFFSKPAFAERLTIASQNLNRLFDDIDQGNRAKIETSKRYQQRLQRIAKHSIAELDNPDIIALQEVENIGILQDLATLIKQLGGPQYSAWLIEGNDVSGIDVGYLIRANLKVKDAEQLFPGTSSVLGPLFSRPPFRIDFCDRYCLTIVNLHLRSMRGLKKTRKGRRVALKRQQQATELASWINQFQIENPDASLMLIGDFNALTPPNLYTDTLGTILGNPDNSNLQYPTPDLIERDLFNLTIKVPANQRFSYVYKGKKQVLDYALISQGFRPELKQIRYQQINRAISDHAALIIEFDW